MSPQTLANPESTPEVETDHENRSASPLGARNEHPRLTQTRELIAGLVGHENAVVRTAVRVALDELDRASFADDPSEHVGNAIAVLDAALNPVDGADQ